MPRRAALDSSRLHEQLARKIANDIVSRRLPENAVVPSAEELATEYEVSRTVAREALQALAAAGLVTVRHGKRTVVAPLSEWRFLEDLVKQAITREQPAADLATDLMETRMVLEVAAARLCGRRATQEHFDSIRSHASECLDRYRTGELDPTSSRAVSEDLRFHRLIAEGSDNHVLLHLVSDIRKELAPTWAIDEMTQEDAVRVWEEHVRIADVLQTRDTSLIEDTMLEHMRHTVDTTLKRSLPSAGGERVVSRWHDERRAERA
ncbi:FadR/GntR family transcriptional regulator [Streptomyces sp. NPDC055607]